MADPPRDQLPPIHSNVTDATSPTLRFLTVDASMFLRPVVLKAVVALIVGGIIVVWPERTDRIISHLAAVAVAIGIAGTVVLGAVRSRRRPSGRHVVTAIGALVLAGVLIATAGQSTVVLGRLLAGAVLVVALRSAIAGRSQGLRGLPAPVLTALVGVMLFIYPVRFLELFTVVVAAGCIAASLIVLFVALDPRTAHTVDDATMTEVLRRWFEDRPGTVDAELDLLSGLFFEGERMRARLSRFYVLMLFATVIASGGVVTDSTAVVIGAMLIAPLMTPLMGMAISLVMGWPNRLLRSTLVALSGIGLVIGTSMVLGRLLPTVIDTTTNSQILSRDSPNLLDLVIAVAAGAAGAFGLSRPDVSDALPGVAIAISLVPPLAVVGLSYSQADWAAGNGALLLFATNMIAILTVGGLVFVVTGITPLSRVAESQHRVRTGLAAVGTATAVVLAGLFFDSAIAATDRREQTRSESLVDDWLQDSQDHSAVNVTIQGDQVRATVVGPADRLPDVDELAERLSSELGRPVTVDVTLNVQHFLTSTGQS